MFIDKFKFTSLYVFCSCSFSSQTFCVEVLIVASSICSTVTGYGNATFLLQDGTIPNIEGTREWWEVDAQRNETDDATIRLFTLNERVASELLAPLSSYGYGIS